MFKTNGWLQGQLSLSPFRGQQSEYQKFLVKSKLPPQSGYTLEAVEPHPKWVFKFLRAFPGKNFFFSKKNCAMIENISSNKMQLQLRFILKNKDSEKQG